MPTRESGPPVRSAPGGTGRASWQALSDQLSLLIARGQSAPSLDCAQLAGVTPELLVRLSELHDCCARAGGHLALTQAPLEVASAYDLICPVVDDAADPGTGHRPRQTARSLNILIPVSRDAVADAIEQARAFLLELGLSELTQYVLRLIMDEVTTNVRLHSGLENGASFFGRLCVTADKTVMTFADAGRPFDPTGWNEFTGPVSRVPGDCRHPFGIGLIRSLSDQVLYRRVAGRLNLLRLERNKR